MKTIYNILLASWIVAFSSCEKFLDRTPLTSESDETAWNSEDNVRLYANKYYTDFFSGYGLNFDAQGGAPLLSYNNSDDVLTLGAQANITRAVPNSGIWSYTMIRSVNILLDRVENRMDGVLTAEAKAHWLGIGRFFRALRYAELVLQYGDIPYYGVEVPSTDRDALYKPRDPRNVVMDAVYDDLRFALQNVRLNDGAQNVNRYIVAGFISRIALYEGTWQKYYYNNPDQAKKFLDLAVEAGGMVTSSNKYDIEMDYRSLFTSEDLSGKKDVLLFRKYDAGVGVTHSVISVSNLVESRNVGPTTDLIKAYICADGRPWQVSSEPDADNFELENLIKTRDSRFEATFYSKPEPLSRASLVYVTKFLPREGERRVKEEGLAPLPQHTSSFNDTDYPVLRYAEVLLNWVEAKAEVAELGGDAVTQSDIDVSINKIRNRPLAPEAASRGAQKTAPLDLGNIAADPNKDGDVSELLWEIRRERRMEFTFEYSRLVDIRRWSKIEYLDTEANPDLLSGGWVNFPVELPSFLNDDNVGVFAVVDLDGNITEYAGGNNSSMVGFYRNLNNVGRLPFLNQVNLNPYLQPIGLNQINEYRLQGYELKQTEGWY
ncbi:RagB/SusD family nutrient uptake outer membrane protein [Sphingobacterium sp. SGG-5]|uniref:RagB/SusD family nutrient uptake outer membrane protein n=1 Tax=Sphingobacterium sp. SGG-5 TaxID=2710881 RepID=UPI0013EC64ED|nr:RagB/SusD family nutrient uptake outer membrane protein [Sphingobacterium sp. SGG-5]NGM62424.1 RagB/SusD family nutrient uptake outer membrane protein [Sphingobacterium sp. SGG-5]